VANKELSDDEFKILLSLAKKVLWSDPQTRKKLQDEKVNIVPANFYSEIPLIDDLNSAFEYQSDNPEQFNAGLFKKEELKKFIELIFDYALEFEAPVEGDRENPECFFWKNPAFSHIDAMAYYCILRHYKPNQILEIGSGFSTLVADQAIKKNGKGQLILIEPFPKEFLRKIESVVDIIEQPIQEFGVENSLELMEKSDVVFIDSTHTVKIGSDCVFIYLKLLPLLKSKTIVHTHDVFLPYGPNLDSALHKHIYWTEQYLLYAYLLDNPKVEILFGSAYSAKNFPTLMNSFVAAWPTLKGASLWYELNGSK
jgi:hypothetical protein